MENGRSPQFAAEAHRFLSWLMAGFCSLAALAGCDVPATTTPIDQLVDEETLREELDAALLYTYTNRHLNLADHAAWQILHGALVYRQDFHVQDEERKLKSAIDHLLTGGVMKGWLAESGDTDQETGRTGFRTLLETGSKTGQGHPDQWLAIFAQCDLPPETAIHLEQQQFTMADWIRQVEWDVPRNPNQEFSWTLIGLTRYRPTTHRWVASDGEQWSIERLVQIELEQELADSACGGSHRLIGTAMALNRHISDGQAVDGVWLAADERIQAAIETARQLQNPNGSFSTNYFSRPGLTSDVAQDLGATGHTLEFLTLAMTDDQLRAPWVRRSATHLCQLFRKTESVPLECGALYHAAHGLALYRERIFGPVDYAEQAAKQPATVVPVNSSGR